MKYKYLYWLILGVSLFITIHLATAQDCEERQEGNLEEGRSCRKPCGNNKDCNKKKNRKCICDDTCGMSCIGPDAVCQNPGEIDHGTVEFDALKYKSVATYSCDEGYTIQGKSERKCRSDGMWAGTAPKCLKRACPFPERRGVAFPETNKEIFEVGDTVTYSCRYGYTLSGNSEVECQADDTWSVPEFLCNKVSCGDPGAPLNGFIEAEDFKFGSWATYKCDEGYEVSNPAKARRYCSSTETWSGEPITCNVKNCGAPDIPEHGDARAPSFDYQSIVTYSCNHGYKLQGNKEGTCRDDNTWGEVPTCIVDTDCNFDSGERPMCGYLNRGVVEWRREFLRADTRHNLPGYVLTYDGVGSSSAVLISPTIPSTKSHCLQFYYYTEGQINNDDVRIKVNTRNVANLVSEDVTNPEFRWVGFQTTMRPIANEDFHLKFEIVAEGRTKLSIDDIAVVKNDCPDLCREIDCQNGGTCVGEIDNAYCSCTQFYTGTFCEKEITCEKPSRPEHGSFFAPDTLTYGSKIIYSCEQGFATSGASTATCGSGGQLSEPPPTCQRILVYDGNCPQKYERHKLMCYRVYKEEKSYSDAEETCMQQGAKLAVVQSKSVNDYLYSAIPSTRWEEHTYWIGLKTTEWLSTWSSQAEFLQISDIAYNMHSLKQNGCGAYFYRGRFVKAFGSGMWHINFNDCNYWNRFICEKWSKGTSSFKVDTPGGGLSGVYKPVAGLLTKEDRQVYGKTEGGSTKYLFYYWNKRTGEWGWFLGEYYVERSKPGPWIFQSKSDVQFPNLLRSQWRDANGHPVQVNISIAAAWTLWSEWTCGMTCGGGGIQYRQRTCQGGDAGSMGCEGTDRDMKSCESSRCPGDNPYHLAFNGISYVFVQEKRSKIDAERFCQNMGRQLATVKGRALNSMILRFIQWISAQIGAPNAWIAYWIGAEKRNDGTWAWNDDTVISTNSEFWQEDQPSTVEEAKCVEVGSISWKEGWDDILCHHRLRFICEKDMGLGSCISDPCRNGGDCEKTGEDYNCVCRPGFKGKNCAESDQCDPYPCQNGGVCNDKGTFYICDCPSGYHGRNCEVIAQPCDSKPCQNEGVCIDEGATYRCNCRGRFSGPTCAEERGPCDPSPCQNGYCNDNDGAATCTCNKGFTGQFCDQVDRRKADCRRDALSGSIVVRINGFLSEAATVPLDKDLEIACSNPGEVVVGERKIRCLGNDNWSRNPKISCAQNTTVCTMYDFALSMDTFYKDGKQVTSVPTSIASGSFLRFECNPSELQGGGTFHCKDGKWESGLPFQCVNENVCPPISSPENGRIVVNPTNGGPPYTYGVEVSFICNPYYETTAAPSITCGREGVWSGEPSKCKATGCLLFQFDLNSGVDVEGHDGSIDAKKGDKFNLICKNGKSKEITCKGKDEWKPSVKSFEC